MDEATIVYQDLELIVSYFYSDAIEGILYDNDGAGCPGSSEDVEVWEVYLGDHEITNLLRQDVIEDIERLILEKL